MNLIGRVYIFEVACMQQFSCSNGDGGMVVGYKGISTIDPSFSLHPTKPEADYKHAALYCTLHTFNATATTTTRSSSFANKEQRTRTISPFHFHSFHSEQEE